MAAARAAVNATAMRTRVQRSGIPLAPKTAPVNARGSANKVCSILMREKKVFTLTVQPFQGGSKIVHDLGSSWINVIFLSVVE